MTAPVLGAQGGAVAEGETRGEGTGAGAPVLGIDAGGSSARWLLLGVDGSPVAQGRVGPVSAIELGREASPALANLGALAEEVLTVTRPQRVVAGVTGLDTGSPQARRLEAFLRERLGLGDGAVTVLGDVVTAYLSAFEPGAGVLVYAGTGSVAVHVASDGAIVRAGGHGYLIDDAGGGYWIGREALKRLLRAADEAGAPPTGRLATAVFGALGGSDWPTVRDAVYGGGRARVASLTPAVALAAARGDAVAREVLAEAGRELARLATVVCGRLGQLMPVALAGGVAGAGPALVDPLERALPSGTRLTVSTAPPVAAAAELARRLATGERSLPAAWSGE
ncbi:MAG TPA: BadF/BadG/BcrA/BcrD ATPase family protein [Trueperaceae bacterium]